MVDPDKYPDNLGDIEFVDIQGCLQTPTSTNTNLEVILLSSFLSKSEKKIWGNVTFFKIVYKRHQWCETFKDKKGVGDDLTIFLQRSYGKESEGKFSRKKKNILKFLC